MNKSNSRTNNKEVVQTQVLGENVDIKVDNHTKLKGATISSIDKDGNDNNKLNLTTNTLEASSLNSLYQSNSKSMGINVGFGGDSISSVGIEYSNDKSNKKVKTLATLGAGNIEIKDKTNSSTRMLNSDIKNNKVDIYDIESHKGLSGKIDTRLLTKDGRKDIKNDIVTTTAITNAIEQIVTTEKGKISDFFSEVQKNVDVYEGMKQELANNSELVKQLQDPNLTPAQKQAMLQQVANVVKASLGYEVNKNDVKLVSTDKKGASGTEFKGHYNDKVSYVNDKNNISTTDLLTTIGHETQHNIDDQDNNHKPQNKDQNTYATNFGKDLSYYTSNALDYTNGGSLASTNTHNSGQVTSTPSVFNDNTLVDNNKQFASVDTQNGDDLGVQGALIGGGLTFLSQVAPELAKQYYQEGKNIFEIDYGKVYDKIDFVDIGAMTVIGAVTPNELSAGSSAKNIFNSVNQYKKYNNLANKTNKNLNKKTRFENKANDNVNTIVRETVIQSGILGLKESIKENVDDEDLKGDE
jgi:hypothetical protein